MKFNRIKKITGSNVCYLLYYTFSLSVCLILGDIYATIRDYNGKVYRVMGGIGTTFTNST